MLLDIKNISYTHLQGTPFASEALCNLSLSIQEGQSTAIIGASKSGKSTLLDLLAGLILPNQGQIFFNGQETSTSRTALEQQRQEVGIVFQAPEAQIFKETVGKDISFGPQRKKLSLAESRRLVQSSLEAVGLPYEDFRTRYTYALSGGEKRRVAIAGMLALQPQVMLFDEPMAGLDPQGRHDLLSLLHNLKKQQISLVYASRSFEDIILLADMFYIIDEGRILAQGTSREIMARLPELGHLDIGLPEVVNIALALRSCFPNIRTDVLTLDELETALLKHF